MPRRRPASTGARGAPAGWLNTPYVIPWHAAWTRAARRPEFPPEDARLAVLAALARGAAASEVSVLRGSIPLSHAYMDLFVAAAAARAGRPAVLFDCIWEPGSRALGPRDPPPAVEPSPTRGRRAHRAMVRALDAPGTHYVVLSREEAGRFAADWGVGADRVHHVPYGAEPDLEAPPPDRWTGVFAGGDSLRDYRALLAVGRELAAPLTVATRLPLPPGATGGTVRAGSLPHEEYVRAARSAAVVVVPLRAGTQRSAGQATYLDAMSLGKPVVVTDAPGVRDHVEDGRTGIVVPPGRPRELREAIDGLLADPARARGIGAAARADVHRRFRLAHTYDRLLALAEGLRRAPHG